MLDMRMSGGRASMPALPDPPGDDPLRVDPDPGVRAVGGLRAAADFHPARAPWVGTLQVVDDDRRAPRPLDVPVLLRPREVAASDLDRVVLGVVAQADRDDVGRAVLANGCQTSESPVAPQVGELRVAERAHGRPNRATARS